MGRVITPVNVSADQFLQWVVATNNAISALTQTVTVSSNATGDTTSGNGFVNGTLGANVLVGSTILGGTISTPGPITVGSNISVNAITTFLGNTSVYDGANLVWGIVGANAVVNTTNFTVTANVFYNGTIFRVPVGSTSGRPAGANGYIRYNTDSAQIEYYANGTWTSFVGGTVSSANVTIANNANVTSTNVQAAIYEVEGKKVNRAGDTVTGPLVVSNTLTSGALSVAGNVAITLANTFTYNGANVAVDVNLLKANVADQTISGGAVVTPKNLGTSTTAQSFVIDVGACPLQYLTCNSTMTLVPGANTGGTVVDIINGSAASTITTSSFTKVTGQFDTTTGHSFRCSVVVSQAGSLLAIQAMQ